MSYLLLSVLPQPFHHSSITAFYSPTLSNKYLLSTYYGFGNILGTGGLDAWRVQSRGKTENK